MYYNCDNCKEIFLAPDAMWSAHVQYCRGEQVVAYQWNPIEYEKLPPITQAARALLQRWFNAMQSGEVASWMPDPFYTTEISMDAADQIVAEIDSQLDYDLKAWANTEAAGSYDSGPGFSRLLPPQRLALAQQLHALKRKYKPAPPIVPSYTYDTGF